MHLHNIIVHAIIPEPEPVEIRVQDCKVAQTCQNRLAARSLAAGRAEAMLEAQGTLPGYVSAP
jgi:hypothetical protein